MSEQRELEKGSRLLPLVIVLAVRLKASLSQQWNSFGSVPALVQGGFSIGTSSCDCKFVARGATSILRCQLVFCKVVLLVQGSPLVA